MMQQIKITDFEGPLDLLLTLVTEKKKDISEISLAEVTGQYLAEVERLKKEKDIANLSGYLEVATELVYLKSRNMLPMSEEDEEDVDLEQRLREYQKYSNATKFFESLIDKEFRGYSQVSPPKIEIQSTFTPPKDLDMDKLLALFKGALAGVPKDAIESETIKIDKINVQEKFAQVKKLILDNSRLSFSELLKSAKSRIEVVVTFLAVLELIKLKTIRVIQNGAFDDILIEAVPAKEA